MHTMIKPVSSVIMEFVCVNHFHSVVPSVCIEIVPSVVTSGVTQFNNMQFHFCNTYVVLICSVTSPGNYNNYYYG